MSSIRYSLRIAPLHTTIKCYDGMHHRFITKIDELMNLLIAEKWPKMQKFIRFITFQKNHQVNQRFIIEIFVEKHSSKVEKHGDEQQGKWVMNFLLLRVFLSTEGSFLILNR